MQPMYGAQLENQLQSAQGQLQFASSKMQSIQEYYNQRDLLMSNTFAALSPDFQKHFNEKLLEQQQVAAQANAVAQAQFAQQNFAQMLSAQSTQFTELSKSIEAASKKVKKAGSKPEKPDKSDKSEQPNDKVKKPHIKPKRSSDKPNTNQEQVNKSLTNIGADNIKLGDSDSEKEVSDDDNM